MKSNIFFKVIAISIILIIISFDLSFAIENGINEIIEKKSENTIDIKYEYNEDTNQVTAKIISSVKLKNTKPTWKLSEDKLTYSKVFSNNTTYQTPVEDINGNVENITINVTEVKKFQIEMEYEYNNNKSQVVVKIVSNIKLKNTKPSWELSEDCLVYSKVFVDNTNYQTPVEDIYGNTLIANVNVKEIQKPKANVTVKNIYDESKNQVTVQLISDIRLKNTKPTWKLSEDGLVYTKEFKENINYSTPVEDINGNVINININVKEVKIAKIETYYYYNNETNQVTVKLVSDLPLKNTKPTWELSEDKLSYTKLFYENMKYTTPVEDVYGNISNVLIEVTKVDNKGPEIRVEYIPNVDNNTVTVIMNSNETMADTKPTWELSEDKLSYTKIFSENMRYITPVQDIYGNISNVLIEVIQVDNKGPEIRVEYIPNVDNSTVTVIMHSNEIIADTKPSWELSEDKLNYTRTFSEDTEYATEVQDVYGNTTWVKIKIITKSYLYANNGPKVSVKYLYDSNEQVTVKIISDTKLKHTKPTWSLSEDKKIYTKIFNSNNIYTTPIEDINGNTINVNIIVNFFKDITRGIDVSEYQKMINWNLVKNSGIDFAFIRAGYRGWGTNGTLVQDRYFATNIQEATKVGMDIGFYFYSQAVTVEEARQEAYYTLELLSKYNVPIKYPIAIDTERTPVGTGRGDKISKELRTDIVIAFCEVIRNAGYKPMIYANKDWLLNDLQIGRLSNYDIWLAHYTSSTDYPYVYAIWQYTSTGSVNGIVGNVDMNFGYKRY